MQALLDAWMQQADSIENAALEVYVGRWPLTAIGEQLDVLGRIVGQPRGGRTDAVYRLWILARILVNRSNGKQEELFDILEVLGVTTDILYGDYYPAEVYVSIVDEDNGDDIGQLLQEYKPAGVTLMVVWSSETEANTFAIGDTLGADEVNATGGFGDLTGATQTTGGYFSGVER
jgi:hypothetical protein